MNSKNKIVSLTSLKNIILRLKKRRKKIAFTNGCFDLLHFGHICYLRQAKKKNRILIVGLNSDSSVRKIKGKGRPIFNQKLRAAVLSELKCTDYITIFNDETPYRIIKTLKPDILIKGADWKNKVVVGQDIVENYGGKVELAKYIKGFSTTKIIKAISKSAKI